MPEVHRLRFALHQISAAPTTVDEVAPGPEWTVLRVAEDEALWLGPEAARIAEAVATGARGIEPGAFVEDVTDGWSGLLLRGDNRFAAFSLLSPLSVEAAAPGPVFLQGDVLGLPAKLLVVPDAIAVFWPATFDAYVEGCLADLGTPLADAAELDWAECAASESPAPERAAR